MAFHKACILVDTHLSNLILYTMHGDILSVLAGLCIFPPRLLRSTTDCDCASHLIIRPRFIEGVLGLIWTRDQ